MVKLAPAQYWEIRARVGDVQAIEAEMLQSRLALAQKLQAAKARANAAMSAAGLDEAAHYVPNDEQCAFVPANTTSHQEAAPG